MSLEDIDYWPMTIIGFIFLAVIIITIFVIKRLLSKVSFSDEGIKITRFRKVCNFFRWDEIIKVEEIPRSHVLSWLSFVSENEHIDVELNARMYKTIMSICPNQNVKNMINQIECFKCFH